MCNSFTFVWGKKKQILYETACSVVVPLPPQAPPQHLWVTPCWNANLANQRWRVAVTCVAIATLADETDQRTSQHVPPSPLPLNAEAKALRFCARYIFGKQVWGQWWTSAQHQFWRVSLPGCDWRQRLTSLCVNTLGQDWSNAALYLSQVWTSGLVLLAG